MKTMLLLLVVLVSGCTQSPPAYPAGWKPVCAIRDMDRGPSPEDAIGHDCEP